MNCSIFDLLGAKKKASGSELRATRAEPSAPRAVCIRPARGRGKRGRRN
jgi:hypothetical protein